jgi:4-amino-4-deoxy-L-arabinose transferase-like glycosyltransferase
MFLKINDSQGDSIMERNPRRALLIIILLAIVLRAGLLFWFWDLPPRIFDAQDYDAIASNLIRSHEFSLVSGHPTSIRPPGYPWFLAVIYYFFGIQDWNMVRIFQVVLGALIVFLTYKLGAEAFNPRVGLIGAAICAVYPSLVIYCHLILTETLFTLLFCLTCFSFLRLLKTASPAWAVFAGIFMAMASLVRSVLWLFPLIAILFIFFGSSGAKIRRAVNVLVFLCSFILILLPWSIRNSRLQHTFVLVDVMGGRNLFMGNYEYTPIYRAWDAINITGPHAWNEVLAADFPQFSSLTQGAIDKLALRQAVAFMKAHPGLTIKRSAVKLFAFWQQERELIAQSARGYFGDIPSILVICLAGLILAGYTVLFILFLYGLFFHPPWKNIPTLFLFSLILFFSGMHALTFGHSRYHIPLIALLSLFAAFAVINASSIWAARRTGRFYLATAGAAAICCAWLLEFILISLPSFHQLPT